MRKIVNQILKRKSWKSKSITTIYSIKSYNTYRPLTNIGIEEDQDDPKEPAHLDYKYIKSFAGPLAKTTQRPRAD